MLMIGMLFLFIQQSVPLKLSLEQRAHPSYTEECCVMHLMLDVPHDGESTCLQASEERGASSSALDG